MQDFHAALLAMLGSFFWALAPVIGATAARTMRTLQFARLRTICGATTAICLATVTGSLGSLWLVEGAVPRLMLSAVVGVVCGDSLLFYALGKLGPRQSSLLYTANIPAAALMAYFFLGESLSGRQLIGFGIACAGILVAVGMRAANTATERAATGRALATFSGLGAAMCQALGMIIAKPALAAGVAPLAANALRLSVSAFVLMLLCGRQMFYIPPRQTTIRVALTGMIGSGFGVTCVMSALALGSVSVVSIFSSLSPLFMLPMLALVAIEKPPLLSWLGAAVTVSGLALIIS